jgi:putative lipoic acid-binding regulatory protein
MRATNELIKFPCSFPIKVMGLNSEEFTSAVLAIFKKHLQLAEFTYSIRLSSSGKYLSMTITFTAESQNQLNAVYEELNGHDLVVMTL